MNIDILTKIKMYAAMIAWTAFVIFLWWYCTSCGTRHEPRIIDKRVNVEDTRQYKVKGLPDTSEADTL